MDWRLETDAPPELAGTPPEGALDLVTAAIALCEAMLARSLEGEPAAEIEVSAVEIEALPGDTAETIAARLHAAVLGKIAADRLTRRVPELIEALRKIRGEVFGADGQGPSIARRVKSELDQRIDQDFAPAHDEEAHNAFVRFWKGLAGSWAGPDVLDRRIGSFVHNLEDYSRGRNVELVVRPAKGVPQVLPVKDNPFSIVYEQHEEGFHKARHEAVHLLHVAQARVTVLEQLLERRRRLGLPASSVQDLSPAELAEAEHRLDDLESKVTNYPAFELAASNVGGTGGRRLRTPTDYGKGLKNVTNMMAQGLASPSSGIGFYKNFGVLHRGLLLDFGSWMAPLVSGSATAQKIYAGGQLAGIAAGLVAANSLFGVDVGSHAGLVGLGVGLLPLLLAAPFLTVKHAWKKL